MQQYHKYKIFLHIAIVMMLSSGCVQQKPLEKLGLITISGFDLSPKGEIKGTAVVQKFDPMVKTATKVITVTAKTSKGLRQKQNLESNQRLVSGQMRSVVFSRPLAQKGIIQLVDTLNRDPTIGNMVYLTIADNTAQELLNVKLKSQNIDLGTYIYNLLRQNVEGEQIVSPTLHEFNHNYADIGKDPVLPVLKVKGQDIMISGVGLFKDDQIVDELNSGKLFYLKILMNKNNAGSQEIGFNKQKLMRLGLIHKANPAKTIYSKLYITLDSTRTKTKIELMDKKNLHYKVEIALQSRLIEMTEPLNLESEKMIDVLEQETNQVMKSNVVQLLTHFQKLGVDPVGFGNEYEAHLRGKPITKNDWKNTYKKVKFDVTVHNTIERTGVMD